MAAAWTDHIRQGKQLLSRVKQLRGHAGSSAEAAAELADALNDLTANRLVAHEYDDATSIAQEAVVASAKLLHEAGPVGAYTPPDVAARYYTALVHVAVTQVGLGMLDETAATLGMLDEFRARLTRPMATDLHPRTAAWALMTRSHVTLTTGDVAQANAWADAALVRAGALGAVEQGSDAAPVRIDVERAVADARWSAGYPDDSIAHLREASRIHDEWVGSSLDQPARLSPALLWFLIAPLVGLTRELADRLVSMGRVEEATALRGALIDRLVPAIGRLGPDGHEMVDELAFEREDSADVSAGSVPAALPGWSAVSAYQALDPAAEGADSALTTAQPEPATAETGPAGRVTEEKPPADRAEAHAGGEPAEQALHDAESALAAARESGRRRSVRDAAGAVVQAVRDLAAADPEQWTPRLIQALEDLAQARRGVGDLWGGRQASKEASALRGR